jgi:hypothetical protein
VIRFIVAVVVGYLCMAVPVMAASAVALAAPDLVFRPRSLEVAPGWLGCMLVVSLAAAAAGGFVAAHIDRSRRGATALAVLVFVVGLAFAAGNEARERPPAEAPADMSLEDRAKRAVQPTWYAFLMPVIGAAGVMLGGRARPEKRA